MFRSLQRVLTSLLFAALCASPALSAERTVDLTATDGLDLKATYFDAANPGPAVLLLHQCNRQRKVWDGLARQLSAAGINVLTFDLRGFGESGGDRFDLAQPEKAAQLQQHWPSDIDVALQYLESQPGVQRGLVGIGGASCGVNNAVQAARRHPEVKSLVLLSGNTDFNGRQFLRQAKVPAFFAVADDDEFPPSIQAIEWLYALTAYPEKKFVHYPTGGHGADMFPVHPELPTLITEWFVTSLITTPGHAPIPQGAPPTPQVVVTLNLIDQPGGAPKVAQQLAEARQHDPKATLFAEDIVNFMGYEHLQSGDTKGAVAILQLNAQAYPHSPNVYDSLSDADLADGQKDQARQNAEKALQLLATDTTDPEPRRNAIKASAEQKLKQLTPAK
jgi:dienelactone hydrolase